MIEAFVENIPDLFLYILPGYVTLRILNRYNSERRPPELDIIFYSALYSFIVGIAYNLLVSIVNINIPAVLKQILYFAFAILLGLIIIKVPKTGTGKKINHIFNSNHEPYSSVWIKMMETTDKVWATVYLHNGLIYQGKLINYTTNPSDPVQEIMLTNYQLSVQNAGSMQNANDFCIVVEDHTEDNNAKVLLHRQEIVSISIQS